MTLYTTAAGDYDTVLFLNGGTVVEKGSLPSGDDKIVNEDGSGDAILFENGDNWVTE